MSTLGELSKIFLQSYTNGTITIYKEEGGGQIMESLFYFYFFFLIDKIVVLISSIN